MRVRWPVAAAVALALFSSPEAWATWSGNKWMIPMPIPYKIFAHSSIKGISNFQSVIPEVQAGFAAWKGTPAGGTIPCTFWSSTYAGTYSSPSGKAALATDGENRVFWFGPWNLTVNSVYAITLTSFSNVTGEITDADLVFNNDYTWEISNTTNNPDVRGIAMHEAGHFLGLVHHPDPSALMYALYDASQQKGALTLFDIRDVCDLYPYGGLWGTACTSDATCTPDSLVCRTPSGPAGTQVCAKDCTSEATCPAGYSCGLNSSGGYSCFKVQAPADLCAFCTHENQCTGGKCLLMNYRSFSCSAPCTVGVGGNYAVGAASCGPGMYCDANLNLCVPVGLRCPGQCTTAADCAPGFGCVNEMCQATGDLGSRCELTGYCKPCSRCAGSSAEAYCRGCCGSSAAGGACNQCPVAACSQSDICTPAGPDLVCAPPGGIECQPCSSLANCTAGLVCFQGRCHSPCDLTNPGQCGACVNASGQGLCACSDETAGTNQSCDTPADGGFIACQNGDVCVGAPKFCRTLCTLGNNTTCLAGEVCREVDSKSVCVTPPPTGHLCAACVNNTCAAGLACYLGRCYKPCPSGPDVDCPSCVDTQEGHHFCACADSLSGVGQACGVVSNALYGCQDGGTCLSGSCRRTCDGTAANCLSGQLCQDAGTALVCGAPGEFAPDAGEEVVVKGPENTSKPPPGCCGASATWAGAPWAALAVLLALRTGRPRRSSLTLPRQNAGRPRCG